MSAQSAQQLKEQGNAAMSGGDFAGAERLYRAALEADGSFMPAAYNLGNALRAQARFEEALVAYKLATDLAPFNSNLRSSTFPSFQPKALAPIR